MKLQKLQKIEQALVKLAKGKTPKEKAKELGLSHPAAEKVIAAYSDCFDDVDADRDLNYFENTALSGIEMVEILSKVVSSYNGFKGSRSPRQVFEAMGDAEYHIAREGSVCIYAKPKSKNYWLEDLKKIKADEVMFDGEKMMFRFWWD